LTQNIQLGGVFALSGAHNATINWKDINIEAKKKTPLLLYNGTADEMIPIKLSRSTFDALLK